MLKSLLFGIFACLPVVVTGTSCAADNGAVDFELPDIEGVPHRLSDYRGRWVIVNYWATWCPPCLDEIPELEMFHETHKEDDAVVLGVNLEDIGLADLRAFVDEQFVSYPVLRDRPRARTELGPIPGMPTTYVVSPEGQVIARQVGLITRKILDDFLARQQQERADRRTP